MSGRGFGIQLKEKKLRIASQLVFKTVKYSAIVLGKLHVCARAYVHVCMCVLVNLLPVGLRTSVCTHSIYV